MSYVKLKKENLQKAYEEGCEDVKKVLRNLYPNEFENNKYYHRGDRFLADGREHILAAISDNEYVLICLNTGKHCNIIKSESSEILLAKIEQSAMPLKLKYYERTR